MRAFVVLALSLCAGLARAAPTVAVLDIEDTTGRLTPRMAGFSKALRTKLTQTKDVRVLDPAKVGKVSGCRSDDCLFALGRRLLVDGVVVTSISESGGSYRLSSELFPVGEVLPRRMATTEADGSAADWPKALGRIAEGLTDPGPIESHGGTTPNGDGVVTFTSVPSGATVWVEGRQLPNRTPCEDFLSLGRRKVKFGGLAAYQDMERVVELRSGATVTAQLTTRVGDLVVVARGANGVIATGVDVYLDGRLVGKAPLRLPGVIAGSHVVLLGADSAYGLPRRVQIEGSKETRVELGTPDLAVTKLGAINADLLRCRDPEKPFDLPPRVELDVNGILTFTDAHHVAKIPWHDITKIVPDGDVTHFESATGRLGTIPCKWGTGSP